MDQQLLTTKEAALYLRISSHSLIKYRQDKTGPKYIKIGGRTIRYRVSDLNKYIDSLEVSQ